jgi:hypothetical protein
VLLVKWFQCHIVILSLNKNKVISKFLHFVKWLNWVRSIIMQLGHEIKRANIEIITAINIHIHSTNLKSHTIF